MPLFLPRSGIGWHRRLWSLVKVALPLLALAGVFGPSVVAHMRQSVSPASINWDACQHVAPYLKYSRPQVFEGDFIADYFEACHPMGYRMLMRVGAIALTPQMFSVVMTYALLLVCVVAARWAAARIGGAMAGWCVAAFVLSSPFFLHNMIAGMPRGFRPPLLALLAAGLVSGNPYSVGVVLVIACGFDPTVTVAGGLALAWMLLATPARWRGRTAGWSFKRRVMFLAVTGLLIGLVHVPVMMATRPYGRQLKASDWVAYPESGPGGRTELSVQKKLGKELPDQIREGIGAGLVNAKQPFVHGVGKRLSRVVLRTWHLWWVSGLLLVALVWLGRTRAASWRLLGLIPASLAAYFLARWSYPLLFEPDRHLVYPLSLLSILVLVTSFAAMGHGLAHPLGKRLRSKPWGMACGGGLAAALMLAALLCVGGVVPKNNGLSLIKADRMAFLEFASTQPERSLFAGHPYLLNEVPLKAERRVLCSFETLLPYHKAYVDETRRRMRALIAATYATNAVPLLQLRDDFGVTHFVATMNQFGENVPGTYPPYTEWVADAKAAAEAAGGFEVLRQRDGALVFENTAVFVLDLGRINVARLEPQAPD
jgi:hypothetical protein